MASKLERPETEKRAGITALAKQLGLSVSTVSRALNGYSDVSEQTRARVLQGAADFNYTPNAASLRLRHGRSDAVGLLLSPSPHRFIEPFYIPLLTYLDEGMRRHGYDLMVSTVPQGVEEDGFMRRLVASKRVDVAVLTRPRRQDARMRYLRDNNFGFVWLGSGEMMEGGAQVELDAGHAARIATERLIGLGHKRIACISGPSMYLDAWSYTRSYRAVMAEHGLDVLPDLVAECEPTEENGMTLASIMFDLEPRPTAIVCNSDLIAWGVTQAAGSRGIVLGRDVSLIGLDNSAISPLTKPPLTTFQWPQKDIADALIAAILSVISGEPAPPTKFRPTLVPRETDGPCPN